MDNMQRAHIEAKIREAYRSGLHQFAYYLELCLKTGELPR